MLARVEGDLRFRAATTSHNNSITQTKLVIMRTRLLRFTVPARIDHQRMPSRLRSAGEESEKNEYQVVEANEGMSASQQPTEIFRLSPRLPFRTFPLYKPNWTGAQFFQRRVVGRRPLIDQYTTIVTGVIHIMTIVKPSVECKQECRTTVRSLLVV